MFAIRSSHARAGSANHACVEGVTVCIVCQNAVNLGYMTRAEMWKCPSTQSFYNRLLDERLARMARRKRAPMISDLLSSLEEGTLLDYQLPRSEDRIDYIRMVIIPNRRRLYKRMARREGVALCKRAASGVEVPVLDGIQKTLLNYEKNRRN